MASKVGSTGRSQGEDRNRKPPLPVFSSKTKPRVEPSKAIKEDGSDTKSDELNQKPESESVSSTTITRSSSAPRTTSSSRAKTPDTKVEGEVKKPPVKTKEVPSRYMAPPRPSPRNTVTAPEKKPPPKSHTPTNSTTIASSGLRSKTPERNTKTPERNTKTPDRNTKTPTKIQPTTPRTATTTSTSRTGVPAGPKRITPTPTAPGSGIKKKPPMTRSNAIKDSHIPLSPLDTPQQKEETIQHLNSKITELQTELKSLTLMRDSIYFQQYPSEDSEQSQSDWDDLASASIDGASENSSEVGDDRDEKYIEMVKRYRSTLSVLSGKIQLLKTALTDARSEYDTLQTQHNRLLADMNKVRSVCSDVASLSL